MTKDQIKDWGHFYVQLSLTAVWNALRQCLGVGCGAAGAQFVGADIFTKIGIHGTAAAILGTIVINVGLKIYANPIPDPTPPAS